MVGALAVIRNAVSEQMIADFFRQVDCGNIEIYNEPSFQLELGCFIRRSVEPELKVQSSDQ